MNISITGNLGSGKSSICKVLAQMGYEICSGGNIFRRIAEEKGLTVVELNELAKKDRSIDDLIDSTTTKIGREKTDAVVDSRIGWNFLEESFNVFVYVDLSEAAKRVFNDHERKSESYSSVEEAKTNLMERQHLEDERYAKLYGIDYYDVNNYHLILDSTNQTPDVLAKKIDEAYKEFKANPFALKIESKELEDKIYKGTVPDVLLHDRRN